MILFGVSPRATPLADSGLALGYRLSPRWGRGPRTRRSAEAPPNVSSAPSSVSALVLLLMLLLLPRPTTESRSKSTRGDLYRAICLGKQRVLPRSGVIIRFTAALTRLEES